MNLKVAAGDAARGRPSQPVALLIGLALGLAGGVISGGVIGSTLSAVARPIGVLWLDALTMTVVPLVFGLLVSGIAAASRSAAAGPLTVRTLIWFVIILTVACLVAAFLTGGLLRVWPVASGALDLAGPTPAPPPQSHAGGEWYRGIIPANPIRAAADTAMVPLVVFALLFGLAASRLDPEMADALLRPIRALVEAMLVLVRWVLRVGPLGVAALAFTSASSVGPGVFGALGQYVVVVSLVCLSAAILGYLWVLVSGAPPVRFARAAAPAQAVALGTQSSLASLPPMVEAAARLEIDADSAGIVLPLAVSLFRAASAAANVAVAVYLAHGGGSAPDAGSLVVAALVAVPVSLGAVGLPAQISFFATIAPVCLAIGAPITALPLLLAVEAVPDLFRTVGNVTNDLAVLQIVAGGTKRAS